MRLRRWWLFLSGRELVAPARCCRSRATRQHLSHRDRQYRHPGIEFAGDDGRRHRGQRRQDAGQARSRRRRGLGETRCGGARKRGGRRRTDQPAGFDARGAQSPAGPTAAGTAAARGHHPAGQGIVGRLQGVLGQIGDIVHNFSAALSGHETDVRQLLTRLDEFVGVLDQQRDRIIASIDSLNRLAGTFASQREVITQALRKIPPALDVLIRERPRITAALDKLRVFSNTATQLVNETQADLVKNLQNLEPTIQALADVGPDLSTVLGYVPTFPFTQNFIDRAVRGDYFNVFAVIDMTIPRLKRTLLAGTRWGDPDAPLVPAPGDPWFSNYTYDPLGFGVTNPPLAPPPSPGAPASAPPVMAPDMSVIAPVDQPSRGGG
ncbi:hypothetical protein MAP_2193 [Mycobacterium avium subsp. paratuberculosis K-10]|uniref:Mammalian cell entry C-terminal domain-containing protein n=1 Tax=Mycolicibacterium paratuberculosis (strain ATCC BAA-968 / K-10) TaxID=262316 RepID=Q73XW5_MYCPA|nr:hypothetical protein MAP_2193 [Mycobacterium avium subsp. paratuberculosis K-10]